MKTCIITGLGNRAYFWYNQIKERNDIEAVAFVEPAEASCRRAVEQHDIAAERIYPSLAAALAACRPDFVLDVTPPAVHHEIAIEAFAAGLPVIGEKPLSDDLARAKQVVAAGRKAGVIHMITQNYRFQGAARTLARRLAGGLIGPPGQCDVQFYKAWADNPGSHYVTQPYMVINDMMVHHFDLMRFFLAAEPTAVHAVTWNQPWGWHEGDACHSIVFEFPGGLHATHVTVACSVGYSPGDYNGHWRFDGPKGSVVWSDGQIRHVHQHRIDEPIDEAIEATEPEGNMLSEFVAALDEEREPQCNAPDNLNSLRMVFAAIESAKQHRWVKLDELT